MNRQDFPLIFERSKPGRTSYSLPELDVPDVDLEQELGETYIRKEAANLPEISELDL